MTSDEFRAIAGYLLDNVCKFLDEFPDTYTTATAKLQDGTIVSIALDRVEKEPDDSL